MDDLKKSRPERLARVMGLASGTIGFWRPEELQAICKHHLTESLDKALSADDPGFAERTKILQKAQEAGITSLEQVFQQQHPSVELLRLIKDYAKKCRNDPRSALPVEIATMMYFYSLATALVRCVERISKLDDAKLGQGFAWAVQQVWLPWEIKSVFAEAQKVLGKA